MVNHRPRFFISFTVAALFGGGCSDDSPTLPPSDDAAVALDASVDDGVREAGIPSSATSGTTARDANAARTTDDDSKPPSPTLDTTVDNTAAASSEHDLTTSNSPPHSSSNPTSEPRTSEYDSTSGSTISTPLPGSVAFAGDQVLDVAITLSQNNLANLEQHGNLEAYLPGEVTITGSGFETYSATGVGVRYKGSYSLHHCWEDDVRRYDAECRKLSLKLKFDEFAPEDQRFDGLKRLNLHASSGDHTKVRELLAYNTFAEFGVDAPRISIARVSINGEVRGLYFAVEELDGPYAAAHYPDGPDGNLYKEIWPVKAQTEEAYVAALETNDNLPDVSDMQGFANAIDAATVETFVEDMAPWVDLDNVVRYLVVDRALKNWDGVMAFYDPIRPHNFFWYRDSGAHARFHLIPWDLDNTFWSNDPYMDPLPPYQTVAPIPDWNETPLNCDPRVVWNPYSYTYVTPPRCDKFLDLLALTQWERFVELGTEFKTSILESASFKARVADWQIRMASLIAEDPTLDHVWVAIEQANFPYLLDGLVSDFGQYMQRGLTDEYLEPGPVLLPEPTEEELAEVTSPRGIEPGRVTNFEFEFALPPDAGTAPSYTSATPYSPTASETSDVEWVDASMTSSSTGLDGGVSSASNTSTVAEAPTDATAPVSSSSPLPFSSVICDPYSTVDASWVTVNPIAGDASARVDFVHNRTPGAYNEWVNLFLLMNDGIVDVTGYTQIEMTLRADKGRYVRVRIGGAAGDDEFGGAWSEFGDYFYVDSYPTHVVLYLHELAYPVWAKDVWEVGQGWEFADELARERFLATMWGLIFVPGADFDDDGELVQATDPGFLEIDNVYFR